MKYLFLSFGLTRRHSPPAKLRTESNRDVGSQPATVSIVDRSALAAFFVGRLAREQNLALPLSSRTMWFVPLRSAIGRRSPLSDRRSIRPAPPRSVAPMTTARGRSKSVDEWHTGKQVGQQRSSNLFVRGSGSSWPGFFAAI